MAAIKQIKVFLQFAEKPNKYRNQQLKTKLFDVLSSQNGFRLGQIRWYGPWRKYCFYGEEAIILDPGCMKEMIGFIDKLMNERRKAKRAKID